MPDTGTFDDLIPKKKSGAFDDLIPKRKASAFAGAKAGGGIDAPKRKQPGMLDYLETLLPPVVRPVAQAVRGNAAGGASIAAKESLNTAAELDKVVSKPLAKARKNVGDVVGTIADPYANLRNPKEFSVKNTVSNLVQSLDPTQLVGVAGAAKAGMDAKPAKGGAKGKPLVNSVLEWLANPTPAVVKFMAGIDDETIAAARNGDPRAMERLVAGAGTFASNFVGVQTVRGAFKSGNGAAKLLRSLDSKVGAPEALAQGLRGIAPEKPVLTGTRPPAQFDLPQPKGVVAELLDQGDNLEGGLQQSIDQRTQTPPISERKYQQGKKYHQPIPEIKAINPKRLTNLNTDKEVSRVSDEVASNMDFSTPVEASVFADGTIGIIDGHHRVAAAKQLGLASIPVKLRGINAKGEVIQSLLDESESLVGVGVTRNDVKAHIKASDTPSPISEPTPVSPTGNVAETGNGATGLANAVQDAEAAAGQLSESPRAQGTTKGEAHAKGKAAVDAGQIDPETLAAEIASGKRTFKDETEVGALLEGKRRLVDAVQKARTASKDGGATPELVKAYEDAQARLDVFVQNVQAGKGKWSDVGRSLQEGTTIDEGNFAEVLADYRARGGKNQKIEAQIEKDVAEFNRLKSENERLQGELDKAKAEAGFGRAATNATRRTGVVGRRTVQQIQVDKEAVRAAIRDTVRKTMGPAGSGLGSLQDAFDAIPELAKQLRKLIELHIEEFKVNRLDAEFYKGAKEIVRGSLDDAEWEALGFDPATLADRDINKILAGYYDQTTKGAPTKNMVAELKKQAQLLDKIEGALEGDVVKYGSGPSGSASPAVASLRKQLNELLKGIGEGPGTDGARTRLQNILAELEAQKQGRFRNVKGQKPTSPLDVQKLREDVASVRRDLRLEDTMADLDEQLRTGQYKKPDPRVQKLTKEQERLQLNIRHARSTINARLMNANKSAVDKAVGVLNLPRTIKASVDISAPGRQGWILGIANPNAARKAFGDQMRALASEGAAIKAQNEILNRPNASLYQKADLYIAPVEGTLQSKEEAFLGSELLHRWKKYNPVQASDRAYVAYLNRLRADVFDRMVNALGPQAGDQQLREIARYINVASGRGDIGLKGSSVVGKQISQAMPAAAIGLWSPRNLASRVQYALGVPMIHAAKVPGARSIIAKEYAKTIIGTGAIIGLSKLALESKGAGSVSGDISNSDFGKIKVGDTRIDLMAGVQQPLVVLGRLMTGKSTSPVSGKSSDLHNPKYGEPGPMDVLARFAQSKANPIIGTASELYTGKDYVGQPVSKGRALAGTITPLSVQEIYDALTTEGVDNEDALSLLNLFGISVSRFKGNEKKGG